MEIYLRQTPEVPELPDGFDWLRWNRDLLETHAKVKWLSFQRQLDTTIFPRLASLDGCVELMQVIHEKSGFCPEATWLVGWRDRYCGTVQGICEPNDVGAIQNLGVLAQWRGLGLGKALLLQAMAGFYAVGMKRVTLEVTARNLTAIRLYHDVGFTIRKTLFREVAANEESYVI
jgi:ribosomal protein S18 acetylase RimI-like enzyme